MDDLELEWKNELNMAENMDNIVTEFRKSRNLKPLRILLHGPPAAGKSRLAQKLREIYGVQHITVKSMIEDILADMVRYPIRRGSSVSCLVIYRKIN